VSNEAITGGQIGETVEVTPQDGSVGPNPTDEVQ
jgi:hypothetical protein